MTMLRLKVPTPVISPKQFALLLKCCATVHTYTREDDFMSSPVAYKLLTRILSMPGTRKRRSFPAQGRSRLRLRLRLRLLSAS